MSAATPAADLWSLDELVDFFKPTGVPVSRTELQRWIARHGVRPVCRVSRANQYDLNDILPVHRDEVLARQRKRSFGAS